VNPHALDLRRHLRVVAADVDGPLEGGKGVPVNGCSCWTIDELVERVALPSVGKLSPSLCKISIVFGVERIDVAHLSTFPAANIEILEGVFQSPLVPLPAYRAQVGGSVPLE
jgi:hypothetical protein